MMRGFSVIGLKNPKTPENIGAVLRAAHCYRVAQVNIVGFRCNSWFKHGTNTARTERHTPIMRVANVLDYVPMETQIVAVDLVLGAKPLPVFKHPERALYVFGPEDGTLGEEITDRAHHTVFIPTRNCMNLAACVNVVLYDRMTKRNANFNPYQKAS